MQIDWNKYLRYEGGKLYWKPREGKDRHTKRWNTLFAGVEAGWINQDGYSRLRVEGKPIFAHRIIWQMFNGDIPDGMVIDHINADPSDNNIENLQLLTPEKNTQRNNQMIAKGFYCNENKSKRHPYCASRTKKLFGTPCGAYMSFMTAFLQGEMNGNSR